MSFGVSNASNFQTGGAVEVERINEADLECRTRGGPVSLGSIKSRSAVVDTQVCE
jgi:hypothetical protein